MSTWLRIWPPWKEPKTPRKQPNCKSLINKKTETTPLQQEIIATYTYILVVYSEDEYVNYEMEYLKMGKGPYWTLARPYHLTSLEIPRTVPPG